MSFLIATLSIHTTRDRWFDSNKMPDNVGTLLTVSQMSPHKKPTAPFQDSKKVQAHLESQQATNPNRRLQKEDVKLGIGVLRAGRVSTLFSSATYCLWVVLREFHGSGLTVEMKFIITNYYSCKREDASYRASLLAAGIHNRTV
ncbi:hypothetical protein BJ322DRAFT_1109573 [Thelephora terrestris]|uniref:Uncharacterized protein n=1 Tax=Thelephora terrestris TaxID=56493 RepID=A0A9P6HDB0_9AGAM|nr:hypothetical protein BJ322DRAFT_1109573 [Thelephora terrestris]